MSILRENRHPEIALFYMNKYWKFIVFLFGIQICLARALDEENVVLLEIVKVNRQDLTVEEWVTTSQSILENKVRQQFAIREILAKAKSLIENPEARRVVEKSNSLELIEPGKAVSLHELDWKLEEIVVREIDLGKTLADSWTNRPSGHFYFKFKLYAFSEIGLIKVETILLEDGSACLRRIRKANDIEAEYLRSNSARIP